MSEVQGYAVIPNWLVRDRSIDRNIKLTYVILSSRADERGICFPSQELIAQELGGVSVRTVGRIIKEMRDMGLVQVYAETTERGRRNRYRLTHDRFGKVRGSGHG